MIYGGSRQPDEIGRVADAQLYAEK